MLKHVGIVYVLYLHRHLNIWVLEVKDLLKYWAIEAY
jgi:hypothetical protein